MKCLKTRIRSLPGWVGVLLLLALVAPPALTSCQNEQPEIDLTIQQGFDGIADAFKRMNLTLEEALALIESAAQEGFAESQTAKALIQAAVASLSGTTEQKLAAVEAAVKAQTTGFEAKLALIEAAVKEGFAAGAAQQELLKAAVEALGGTLEEKLAAIEDAVKVQTFSLETKIGLVEAALQEGLADGTSAQELLKSAIESLGGTLAEKIAAIEKAIGSQTTDLSAKLGLIETAVKEGFAEAKELQALIQTALDSLSGTAEEKLAAIEKAVTGQTTSLETKLDLIEAAVKESLTDGDATQELIKKAIESLGGTLAAKLAAIETAIGSETTDLSAKLGLIETAVKEGLTGEVSQQALIAEALDSLSGDLEGKLAALEKAVTSQTSSLETKLIAIETAVSKGFASEKDQLDLIQKAIETLSGTTEKKLEAIEKVVTSQTTSLGTKLTTIETALKNGIGSVTTAEGQIQQALTSLAGTAADKLGEIVKALSEQKTSLDTYLSLIEQAIKNGFADSKDKQNLIETAIKGLGDTVEVVMKKLQEAMSGPLSGLDTKLETIGEAVAKGFADGTKALGLIKDAVDKAQESIASADTSIVSVSKALADVVQAIKDTDKTIKDDVSAALTKILDAIVAPPDYSALLEEIKQAIELINASVSIEFSEEYVKDDEVMMLTNDQLSIAYTVISNVDAEVTVTSSDDIAATVVPDPDNPLEGIIEVKSGNSITEGKTQVVVTVSSKTDPVKRTLTVKEAYLTPVSSPVDSIPIRFEGETLEIQYRTNLKCADPYFPDSTVTFVKLLKTEVASDMTTLTIGISSNDGDRPRLMGVTINETRFNKAAITFSFWQQCDDREIIFEDDALRRKIVRSGLDVNGDGKISRAEARAAKSLTTLFGAELTDGADYESFNEFWYFKGIDTIPEGSFRNWKQLKQITLPESITTIMGGYGDADGPFVDCPLLESISGKYATADSTALIYEGRLLKVVEQFNDNTEPYEIPEGVKVIGSKAFYKSPLKNVKFPESLTTIRDRAFEYSQIDSVVFRKNEKGAAYVDSIAENSFIHCFCLKGFDGPMTEGSVRVTPDYLGLYRDTTFYAFALGADAITYVIPGDLGIKKLAASVFSVMEKNDKGEDVVNSEVELLLYLGLPSTITHIREHAFSGQTRGLHIYFAGENPPRMDVDVFDYAKDVTLWVPAGADDTESSARIASFTNAIDQKDLHRIKEILPYTQSQWPFSINTSASGTGENFVWD